ncbi:MAG: hypothetical protein GF308_07810 [Candidatus Heimdallarchaeota archaeon]|nr:hypothetical protein [Candidatus Heimdallarchaeota archaeon]
MARIFLLFSHSLTEDQITDTKTNLGVTEFVSLSSALEDHWKTVPTRIPSIIDYLEPIRNWLTEKATKGDYVLIQGDFGATYLMVNFCFSKGFVPIYATTERQVKEQKMPDGSIKLERTFKHKIFRRYERLNF